MQRKVQGRLLTAASAGGGDRRAGVAGPATRDRKAPRPFKSAEKPISLHPLSFKQALVALLQIGPPRSEPRDDAPDSGPPTSEP